MVLPINLSLSVLVLYIIMGSELVHLYAYKCPSTIRRYMYQADKKSYNFFLAQITFQSPDEVDASVESSKYTHLERGQTCHGNFSCSDAGSHYKVLPCRLGLYFLPSMLEDMYKKPFTTTQLFPCSTSGSLHGQSCLIDNWTLTNKLQWIDYRKISNIRCTKSQNLIESCLVLQLSLPNPLNPGVKSRMKM